MSDRHFTSETDLGARDNPIQLLGRPVKLERFRPWYERWFTRPWRPFVKWEVETEGTLSGWDGHSFTVKAK